MSASVAKVPGVVCVDLNYASATLLVDFESAATPQERIVRVVEGTGHGVRPLDDVGASVPVRRRRWLDRHLAEVATAGSGALTGAGIAMGWLGAPEAWAVVAFVAAIGFGGLLVWRRALSSIRAGLLDMNVLMTVAVLGAAGLGEWGEAATVYFLFALGGLLESRSLERTRHSIRDLMQLAPQRAQLRRGGTWVEVDADTLQPGDEVLVRPGERVPIDGEVTEGFSAIDEAAITGESVPVDKEPGDTVFAGTLNTTGVLELRVTAAAKDSTLARIVYLVEEAQAARAPMQTLVERFSRWYTPSVIVLAALVAVIPPLLALATGASGGAWAQWFERALVLLVVSCPCALVISTPVSIVSGITRASRDGVLVKGGAFLELAAHVDAVAFDKTGTLTRGVPELVSVMVLDGAREPEVIAVAGALESHSTHPIARALARAAHTAEAASHLREPAVSGFTELPGAGVTGVVAGETWSVASPAFAASAGVLESEVARAAVESTESAGHTALVVSRAGSAVAVLGVADEIRPETPGALEKLRRGGIKHLVMLTGDNERVAARIAQAAGLTEVRSRLLPEDKTAAVVELRGRYKTVAMVGDGVNDAPALAASDLGIAMGAAGSDTALETADVALMRDDLEALVGFFALGRRTVRTIVQNVVASVVIKFVFLALALTGTATLWMAVFADTGVALLVILNGMRLLRPRRD